MRQVQEVTNVRETQERPSIWAQVWTQAQYLNLTLTIVGQILVGSTYLLGQMMWLIANLIAVARDVILRRPAADVVRDVAMTALTAGLIGFYLLGGF